jgi:hypothetical protein
VELRAQFANPLPLKGFAPMKLLHLTLGLTFLLPLGAAAGEFWRYETEEGVVSFVDDAKKIPEKYRASAVRQESDGLSSYARATLAGAGAPKASNGAVVMPVPNGEPEEAPPFTRTKEFRWVDGVYGAPSEVYTMVEVVRDADGEIVSVELHDPDIRRVITGR